jgi:hypothetical protein
MNELGAQLLSRLRESLPGSDVYWEKEPTSHGFRGSVLTAEYKNRKFTLQFESDTETPSAEELDGSFIEQVVDDFTAFFARSIYPKEKFTKII